MASTSQSAPTRPRITYFTASGDESKAIDKYMRDQFRDKQLVFYGILVHWCTQRVSAFRQMMSKGAKDGDDIFGGATDVYETLGEKPLTAGSFIRLIERCRKQTYENGSSGTKTGVIDAEAQGMLPMQSEGVREDTD